MKNEEIMEKVKNDNGLYEIWYFFDDDLKFHIREISEKDMKYILKQSEVEKKTWKKEKEIETDSEKFWNLAVLKSVIGFEGLTNEKLADILDPKKFEDEKGWNYFPAKAKEFKADFKIEFDEEIKRTIAQNAGGELAEFLSAVYAFIRELKKEDIKSKLKN